MADPGDNPIVLAATVPYGESLLLWYLSIVGIALLLAAITGILRIWFPIDKWVYLLGFIRVAFADVPRDLSFFIIGVLAYDRGWFQKFPSHDGYIWLGIGIFLAVFWYVYSLFLWQFLPAGGITIDILALDLGNVVMLWLLHRSGGPVPGKVQFSREPGQNPGSQPVCSLYFSCLVRGSGAVLGNQLAIPPLAKFTLVTQATVPLTFLFSNWVRKPLHL